MTSPLDQTKGVLSPPIPVPTHGPNGTFAVKVTSHINASPETVLAAVRDTTTWPKWNTFCPSATIDKTSPVQSPVLEVGSVVNIAVCMAGKAGGAMRDQGVVVTFVDREIAFSNSGLEAGVGAGSNGKDGKEVGEGNDGGVSNEVGRKKQGWRIAWIATGYSNWQLRSERVMEFVDDGKGGTEYVCWETFGGALGVVVKGMVGSQLVERFMDYARDLKGFVEGDS